MLSRRIHQRESLVENALLDAGCPLPITIHVIFFSVNSLHDCCLFSSSTVVTSWLCSGLVDNLHPFVKSMFQSTHNLVWICACVWVPSLSTDLCFSMQPAWNRSYILWLACTAPCAFLEHLPGNQQAFWVPSFPGFRSEQRQASSSCLYIFCAADIIWICWCAWHGVTVYVVWIACVILLVKKTIAFSCQQVMDVQVSNQ